eukprot:3237366-Rhodomonas_salina.3
MGSTKVRKVSYAHKIQTTTFTSTWAKKKVCDGSAIHFGLASVPAFFFRARIGAALSPKIRAKHTPTPTASAGGIIAFRSASSPGCQLHKN